MKSVYQYQDYREFIEAYYKERKKDTRGFSYRKFAEISGMNSPNYLKLIVDGSRDLTVANIHQVAKAMKLSDPELQYFETLVLYNQSSVACEKSFYKRRLNEIKKDKPSTSMRTRQQELISRWYYPAVLVALKDKKVNDAIDQVCTLAGVNREQAQNAIEVFKHQKIIEVKDDRYQETGNHWVFHDPALRNQAQRQFLREQLETSLDRFRTDYEKGAKFYAHTFTVAEENLKAYQGEVLAFLERITELSDREPIEKVMQLNIQFFPVTKQPVQPIKNKEISR